MRVGVFSDLHGNQYALDAFMKRLPALGLDRLIFCGDIFGYYYGQREIIDSLSRQANLTWLLGNHDRYYLDLRKGEKSLEYLVGNYGRSYELALKLPDRYAQALQRLQARELLELDGKSVIAVHGAHADPLEGRLYPSDIPDAPELPGCDVLIMGHTHYRMNAVVNGLLLLNPGSLGQPRDGKPAGLAVLTLPERSVEFIDVEYDKDALERDIVRADPGFGKLLELLRRSDA
jgi:putative phosphoesterase